MWSRSCELALLVLEPARDHDHAEVEEVPAEIAQRDARRLADGRIRASAAGR